MTELGYLDGVTSALQTQLNTKKVLQVVYGSTATEVTNTTETYADTGITASITPSAASSKILVITSAVLGCYHGTGDIYIGTKAKLLRGSTDIAVNAKAAWTAWLETYVTQVFNVLDAPNTTNAVTYKVQFGKATASGTSYVCIDSSLSSIVLMEIAA
jgi:hypothetical protein